MLDALWLYPPLAFARLGLSEEPLGAFHWGPNDESLDGTGKTTIIPAATLADAEDGTLEASRPEQVRFADTDGVRPVCPFFELHGRWEFEDGVVSEGPITEEILARAGKKSSDLSWEVRVANLKAYSMTLDEGTRIEAEVSLRAGRFEKQELKGVSPAGAGQPLVPAGQHIALGAVRLIKPSDTYPGLRLRFYPPKGDIYGPTNLKTREFEEIRNPKTCKLETQVYDLADKFLILNAGSSWPKFTPPPDDPRRLPSGLFATDKMGVSLGLVDDVSDGIISCVLDLEGEKLVARARVVVAPPHYAPDRRHLVSIADGLKDRVGREEIHADSYFSESKRTCQPVMNGQKQVVCRRVVNRHMARLEVHDLLERVFETLGLSNLDAFNNRVAVVENPLNAITSGVPYTEAEHTVFNLKGTAEHPLPLVERAQQAHRRLSSLEIFENRLRHDPSLIERVVRQPADPKPYFDQRMPALMHGSSGEPLHLTRRQYDLLAAWARLLFALTKEGS